MSRTLVISDIHGELEKFQRLLQKVEFDSYRDQLILLGDYIDRGPDSKGVLSKVIKLKGQGAIVLRGNHEDLMIDTVYGKKGAAARWLRNGGIETMASYGVPAAVENGPLPKDKVFKQHISFLETLKYYYETEDYIFVHGGVDPNRPVHETPPLVLAWIRDEFHQNYRGEKTVIFGHTPTHNLHEKENNTVYFGNNNIIGIDGGAIFGGQLNCFDVHNKEVYFVT